jgi:APA family basic amino acid/polyamine antiporter
LGTFDAVVIGLGAMIGAGVFSAYGPAARAAGRGLLLGLLVAAAVAYCNATSSAQLAALHPEAGGAYAYGRRRLGAVWGFVAGWGFVVGKIASCSAMALTFASYAVANAAALTLSAEERRWPRGIAAAGLLGCIVIAFSLPLPSVLGGTALLGAGAAVHLLKARLSRVR